MDAFRTIHLLLVTVLISVGLHNCFKLCSDLRRIVQVHNNRRSQTTIFRKSFSSSIITCVQLCMEHTKCLSVSFFEMSEQCNLHTEDDVKKSHLVHQQGAVFTATKYWPGVLRLLKNSRNDFVTNTSEKTKEFSCGNSGRYMLVSNSCLRYIRHSCSWRTASRLCKSQGAHLVTINSARKETSVVNLLNNVTHKPRFWIGLIGEKTSYTFTWTDGTNFTYSHWMVGEPNHLKNVRRHVCVEVRPSRRGVRWNDKNCNSRLPFFCERKPIIMP